MVFTVSAANGPLCHQLSNGGMNSEHFRRFLEHVDASLPRDNVRRVSIFDKASSHGNADQVHLAILCYQLTRRRFSTL